MQYVEARAGFKLGIELFDHTNSMQLVLGS